MISISYLNAHLDPAIYIFFMHLVCGYAGRYSDPGTGIQYRRKKMRLRIQRQAECESMCIADLNWKIVITVKL